MSDVPVIMPRELTAENGAKALLLGEFFEQFEVYNAPHHGARRKDMTKTNDADRAPVHAVVMRPGPGWWHAGGPCYDHSEVRIHVGGLARFHLSENVVDGNRWPESQNLRFAIRMCGGNRKRGVMVWALNLLERGYA